MTMFHLWLEGFTEVFPHLFVSLVLQIIRQFKILSYSVWDHQITTSLQQNVILLGADLMFVL